MGLLSGLFGYGGSGILGNNNDDAPGFTPPSGGGWFGNTMGNPMVQFGLGLASGATPQEGFGNALAAQLNYQKMQRQREQDLYQRQRDAMEDIRKDRPGWGPIGVDPLSGQLQYGWHDPKNQTVTPYGGSQSQNDTDNNANFGAAITNPDKLSGEEYLQLVPPQVRNLVKGVGDYEINPQTIPFKGAARDKIIEMAVNYKGGDYQQQNYFSRLQTTKSFAPGGKDAETVKSYNQAIIHADQAWDLIPKIEGMNVGGVAGKIINTPYGEARAATDPEFARNRKRYENLVNALSGELMKASRGSGQGSLEEIRNWKAGALAANSGEEMRGALQGGMDFLHGAMEATARKKSEGMKSQFAPSDLLSEGNKQSFEKVRNYTIGGEKQMPLKNESNGWTTLPDGRKIRLKQE